MSYSATVLADGPAGYWPLDETSGTTAFDSSGNSEDGTYVVGSETGSAITLNQAGATAFTGKSVLFVKGSGGGSYNALRISNHVVVQLSGDMSLEAWFKTTASGATTVLISKYDGSGAFPGYALRMNSTGHLGFYSGDSWQDTPSAYNDGAWHHVVGVLSGTTTIVYVDGASVATATCSPSLANSATLRLGIDPSEVLPWSGGLDEIAIYDSALSATRVLAHYTAGTTAPAVTTFGWYADYAMAGGHCPHAMGL